MQRLVIMGVTYVVKFPEKSTALPTLVRAGELIEVRADITAKHQVT